ncbi:MAG: hypothetical protein FWH48_06915 [Oscillospiraceae bacterium]|nr:hypothetical protein [Oscillospiraceae bacterium]
MDNDRENYNRLKKEVEDEMAQKDTLAYKDVPVIAIYDVRGIQSYIFKTNKLKEIEGASSIVNNIFIETLKEAIGELEKEENQTYTVYAEWENKEEYRFADGKTDIEVVSSAAGNTTVLFKSGALCRKINKKLSFLIIKKTYSLNLAIAVVKKTKSYKDDYTKLKIKLGIIKAKMSYVSFAGSFPLTRKDLNNDPESEYSSYRKRWVSREVYQKLEKDSKVNGLKQLDEMKIEKNIAIVHIDGNGIGGVVGEEMKDLAEYKEAVSKIREVSKKINRSFNKEPIDEIKVRIAEWKETQKIVDESKSYFREVINAGDDITFVCSAEIAMSLCEIYINKLKEQKSGFTACAGIAYIGSHFPFSRGYEIAEKCCDNAKRKMREKMAVDDKPGYWLDFQIVRFMINDLKEHRETNYMREGYNLLSRPYCLDESNNTFEKFKTYIEHFSDDKKVPRSWCKELRNAYDAGKATTAVTISKMQSRDHKLPEESYGLYDENKKTALYFDALEMMDYYEDITIKPAEGGKKS